MEQDNNPPAREEVSQRTGPTADTDRSGMRTAPYVEVAGGVPVVPGYEVRGRLGRGGMGEVLRVHDPDFDRPLALKVMRAELLGQPGAEARFLAEARVTGRLQHPAIPPVHEMGRLPDGRPFFLMKLIEGRTLHECSGSGRRPRRSCRVSWPSSARCARRSATPTVRG